MISTTSTTPATAAVTHGARELGRGSARVTFAPESSDARRAARISGTLPGGTEKVRVPYRTPAASRFSHDVRALPLLGVVGSPIDSGPPEAPARMFFDTTSG